MNLPVAVYGTLMKDEVNYDYYLSGMYNQYHEGYIQGAAIYSTGGFPFMVLHEEDPDIVSTEDWVNIHIFDIPDENYESVMRGLDSLEGHPFFYERKTVSVMKKAGNSYEEINAWIYIARSVRNRRMMDRKMKDWIHQYIAEEFPSEDSEELPIAVYGTLRLNQGNYRNFLQGNYRDMKRGRLLGGTLHMGGCPYLHLYSKNPNLASIVDKVVVDVFYVEDNYKNIRNALDRLEGHPVAWRRIKTNILIEEGDLMREEFVWIYLANDTMVSQVRGSDWVKYINERRFT